MCAIRMMQESLRAFKYGPLRSQSTSSTGSGSAFQAATTASQTGEEGVAVVANGNHTSSSNGRSGTSASSSSAAATSGAGANGNGSKMSRTSSTSSGHGTAAVSSSNSAGGGVGLPLAAARASRRSSVLYVAVTLALERKSYHRELVSQLLAECVSPIGRGLAQRSRPAINGANGVTPSAPLIEADEDEEDDSPVSTPSTTNLNANPFDKANEEAGETRSFFAQTDAEAGFDRLIRELPELVLCVALICAASCN